MGGLGSLIGGIGALGGGGSNEVVNRVDYKRLVKDATAAGFNPLTALRNGGAAGFSITSGPSLSSGSQIGQAVSGLGDFLSSFDPFEDKMREVQFRTQQEQLKGLQYDNQFKARNLMFDPPAVSGRRVVSAGPSLGQKALKSELGTLPAETQIPQRTNPYPLGSRIEVNPWLPDMQNWEDHFGDSEIMSMIGGALQLGGDAAWNGYRLTRAGYRAYQKGAPERAKRAEERAERIRREAAENARDLGFIGY